MVNHTHRQPYTSLLRHMRSINPNCLDKKDASFSDLHVLDSVFHQLHSDGIGTN